MICSAVALSLSFLFWGLFFDTILLVIYTKRLPFLSFVRFVITAFLPIHITSLIMAYCFVFGFGTGVAPTQNPPTTDRGNVYNARSHEIDTVGGSPSSFQTCDGPVEWTIAGVVCK